MTVAVVGTGSIGRRHLANLLRLGVRDVIAVSEHNRRVGLEIDGTSIPVVHEYTDVLGPDVEAVVIGNPTSLHRSYLARALAADKHVYLEKPAAESAEGLDKLATQAEKRGLVVAVGTMYRFNGRLVSLERRLAAGAAGRLLSVETMLGEHIADYHPGEDYRQGYAGRAELGGGVLLTQIHQIDWLNWLFGPFECVFAVGDRRSDLEIDVEDNVSYLLRARFGVPVYGHLDYLQRPKRVTLTVTGEDGRFHWDLFADRLEFSPARAQAAPEVETGDDDRNAMFAAAMTDFLDCVRTGRTPRSSLQDGLTALRIVDAIKASLVSGRTELIEP